MRSATEALVGDDKFFCYACKGLQDAQKRMKIKALPHVLCLHLKRFKHIEQQDRYCRGTNPFAYMLSPFPAALAA